MKVIIHTERLIKDEAEFKTYLNWLRENNILGSIACEEFYANKRVEFITKDAKTIYTLEK